MKMKAEIRVQGVASVSQGAPKFACKAPEAKGGAWNRWILSQPSVGTNPASTVMLDFQPPELWGNMFLSCLFLWLHPRHMEVPGLG